MAGKPFRSMLIPYQDEIARLRSQKPPVAYARIAEILLEKHGLTIKRAGIAKFVKVRSRGRKVYFFRPATERKQPKSGGVASDRGSRAVLQVPLAVNAKSKVTTDDDFGFTYSQTYNLTRLPPEEAAARRKKLEAEGH